MTRCAHGSGSRVVWSVVLTLSLLGAWPVRADENLSQLSGEELEARVAELGSLTVDERRALLTEIHKRMVAAGKEPVVRIRAERRYGYRIRQPDGSVVEIHKRERVIRYRRLDPDRPFGVGFERRRDRAQGLAEGSRQATSEASPGSGRPDAPASAAAVHPIHQLPLPKRLRSSAPDR